MALTSNNNSLPPYEANVGIENRNFLSPIGFRFAIDKMRGVDFFCQSATVPQMTMGSVDTGTRFNRIPQPGDELNYDDLTIRFLVDENMKNFYQVHDWMRQIATPYSSKEFKYKRGKIESQNDKENNVQWRSDCSLFILSSNYQPVAEFVFKDAFPVSLTSLPFDAANEDIRYFTAECQLKYTYFDYYIYEAATATDSSMPATYRRSELGVELS
ncbi:tail completion protein [Synechococcus phage S-B68]|nr:tail completion protein [Synechococcus phage S-B68]